MLSDESRTQKIRKTIFIHPSFTPLHSFTLEQNSVTQGLTIHPVKNH